jgi:dephospho-CoA kinase
MLVIGLIGQIGSGKSTAGQFFQALGVPVIDADHVARLTLEQTAIQQQILDHFGPSLKSVSQGVNRQRLKQLIFNDADAKHWLEQLLHPLIQQSLKQQLQAQQSPYAIVLLPLLPPNRAYLDRLLIIETDRHLQQQRVLARDAISELLLQQIIDAQASPEQLRAVADDILTNNADLIALQAQVLTHHLRYLALAKTHKAP